MENNNGVYIAESDGGWRKQKKGISDVPTGNSEDESVRF